MEKIIRAMEKAGIPGRDLHDQPASEKTFPDGCQYRVELSGMESVGIFKAGIDEAKKQKVPFHKAISLVRGATLYTDDELREFAQVASDNQIEVIITPGPRPTWYTGRMIATPEGGLSGLRMRGCDSVRHYLADIYRCLDFGFKGFLVWDEGILHLVNMMRENGDLPKDITFKVSVFAGHANPAGGMLLEKNGAGTFNPVADLTVDQLASIRSVVNIPLDIHIQYWDGGGGFNRMYEAADIARVAAPCYFKMEPGPGLGMYAAWGMPEGASAELARYKIRCIRNIIDIIDKTYPDLKVSPHGAEDLKVPVPK